MCIEKKLILELDGSQHLEQKEYDEERTKFLEAEGYRVIRFWNNDVMQNTPALARWCKCGRGYTFDHVLFRIKGMSKPHKT